MAKRTPASNDPALPFVALERLVRERSYLRPLPPPPARHQMARARLREYQDADYMKPKETKQ